MKKIKIELSKHARRCIYERFPLLDFTTQEGLIKNLNKTCSYGYLSESSEFAEEYFLYIPDLTCTFVLTSHFIGKKDHYIAKTVKNYLSRLRVGRKVSIRWYGVRQLR